ncbi:MAG: IS110 family transposase [Microthrixaceae bacterium]
MVLGVDPHKATHTAVAVDATEAPITTSTVRSDRHEVARLLAWAAPLGSERVWAVESANGLGHLLSQQLVAAGEHVVDVPATLAARVRLLGSTKASKNDPNDALSTAIAGLRHDDLRQVGLEDHAAVLRLLADRHRHLTALRTRTVLPAWLGRQRETPTVGVCATVLRWLDRGEVPPSGDPEAPVEIANVSLFDGPRLVALLSDAGIEGHGIEATTEALHGSAQTRMRILVRRRDAGAAVEALQHHGISM